MSSFKNLIRSDISVVPYEANKQWSLSYCPYPTSSQYLTIYTGTNVTGIFSTETDPVTEGQYERLVYNQINHLFYQTYTASLNTSSLANSIYYESASQQRPTSSYFIYNDKFQLVKNFPTGADEGIRVIAINQDTYGNKVLPYTFILSSSAYFIVDDGYGNLLTLQGAAELYINNGYFNAAGYFADNIVNANDYIGNIFYAHGIAIITNQSFQTMFPLPPLAVNDTVYFQTTDSPKTVSPLTNDQGRGGTIEATTLTLSGSTSELSYWTNNGDGTIELDTTVAGTYTVYYTVEASYDCGNIISNKGKITAVVTTTPPPTTTTTTTTTSTTTTTTTLTPANIFWANTELGSPYIDSDLLINDDGTNIISAFTTENGNFNAAAGSSIYSQQNSQGGTIGNYRLYIENTTDATVLSDNTSTPGSLPATVNSYTFTAQSGKSYYISASVAEITTTTTSTTTTTTTTPPTTTTTTTTSTTTTTTTEDLVTITLYAKQEGVTYDLDFHYSTDGGSTWNFISAPFNSGTCDLITSFQVIRNSPLSVRVGSDSSINIYYPSNRDTITCPAFNNGTAVCEWGINTSLNRTFYHTANVEDSGACSVPTTSTTTSTSTTPP